MVAVLYVGPMQQVLRSPQATFKLSATAHEQANCAQ